MEKEARRSTGTKEKTESIPVIKIKETDTEQQFYSALNETIQNHEKQLELMDEKFNNIQMLKKKRI